MQVQQPSSFCFFCGCVAPMARVRVHFFGYFAQISLDHYAVKAELPPSSSSLAALQGKLTIACSLPLVDAGHSGNLRSVPHHGQNRKQQRDVKRQNKSAAIRTGSGKRNWTTRSPSHTGLVPCLRRSIGMLTSMSQSYELDSAENPSKCFLLSSRNFVHSSSSISFTAPSAIESAMSIADVAHRKQRRAHLLPPPSRHPIHPLGKSERTLPW